MGLSSNQNHNDINAPRPINSKAQLGISFNSMMNDSFNHSTFTVGDEDIEKGIDLDGNETICEKFKESSKIPIENLYP